MSAGLQCKRSWVQILASTLELFQKSQNSLFNWGHKWTWMLTLRLCLLEVLGYIRKVLGRDRKVLGRDRKALGCVRKALSCIRIGSLGWVQNLGSIRGNDVRSREKCFPKGSNCGPYGCQTSTLTLSHYRKSWGKGRGLHKINAMLPYEIWKSDLFCGWQAMRTAAIGPQHINGHRWFRSKGS